MQSTLPEKMLSVLPGFTGFYDSMHKECIEALEGVSQDDFLNAKEDPEEIKRLEEKLETLDFASLFEKYARAYVRTFSSLTGIPLEFESLQSPRFYNYSTDRIFVYVPSSFVAKLWHDVVDDEDFYRLVAGIIMEEFSPRPGFSPSYSSDIQEWLKKHWQELDHNEVAILLSAAIVRLRREKYELREWDTLDRHICTEIQMSGEY